MESPLIRKIVWAVDVTEPEEFQNNSKFLLGALARETSAEILPLHVLRFPMASAGERTDYEDAYMALAEKRLRELPEKSDIPQMKIGEILVERTGRLRKAVEKIIAYAREKEADAIVVSTHSRGAVSRFFMGSFAESLLLQSEIPVITVNPLAKVRESISRVLFPTTFREEFRAGFQSTVKLCALFDASLTLLYKEPYIPMVGDGFPEYYRVLEEEARKRANEASQWREWANERGVPVELRMDSQPGNVAETIEDYASQHNFDLIVMVSQTLEADVPRVGSICRRVVRGSQCPVWTMKTDDYDEEDFD